MCVAILVGSPALILLAAVPAAQLYFDFSVPPVVIWILVALLAASGISIAVAWRTPGRR